MIIGFEGNEISNWKKQLHNYQQRKKLNTTYQEELSSQIIRPVHKNPPSQQNSSLTKNASAPLQSRDKALQQQTSYFLAQKYLQHRMKYEKAYDIVTLNSLYDQPSDVKSVNHNRNRAPIRNLYNLINGEKYSDQYLKNRVVVLPSFYEKKEIKDPREFNIINNNYKKDNDDLRKRDQIKKNKQILQNYERNCVYDKIYGRYYSPEQQEKYWQQKTANDIQLSKQNFENKLPPTYQVRERFIQDLTKPLPEGVVKYSQAQQNNKNHLKVKYLKEDEYRLRNIQIEDRKQRMTNNRILRTNDIKGNKSSFAGTIDRIGQKNINSNKIKSVGFDQK